MNRLIYFATNGLGECICQSPALRQLAKTNTLIVVAPDNIVPYFCDLSFVKEVVPRSTVNFKENWDGSFSCDSGLMDIGNSWTSPHYYKWDEVGENPQIQVGGGDYVTAYCKAILGKEYVEGMREPEFFLEQPEAEEMSKPPDITLFQGSTERLRRLPEEYLVKIYSGLRRRGFKVNLFTAIGNSAGEQDFKVMANCIANSSLVITPDSGPFHLSLAMKKKTLFMPTREHWSVSFHPVYEPIVYTWMKREGLDCDQKCRGRTHYDYIPYNYPLSLNCWGGTCSGFKLNDDDVAEIVNYATSILDGKPVDKARFYPIQLNEGPLLEEGPQQEPSLASSHSTGSSTQALATPV